MDVDVVQRGEVAEFDDNVIEPDHSGIPSSLLPGLWADDGFGKYEVWRAAGLAIQNFGVTGNYSAFCVSVAQSRLSQSGSVGALLASAQ